MKKLGLSLLVGFALLGLAHAAEDPNVKVIRAKLAGAFPEIPFSVIERSPYKELYQVVSGHDVFYVSPDGNFLLADGAMLAVPDAGQKPTNLTQDFLASLDKSRAPMRADELSKVKLKDTLTFAAPQQKYEIFVFTDIDCAYCRKLHGNMAQMNSLGITVHYLGFPRSGLDTPSYDKLVSVWCSDDPKKALTAAKTGVDIQPRNCKNPIRDQYALVQKFGLSGTPAIILKDGTLLPGYLEPQVLVSELAKHKV